MIGKRRSAAYTFYRVIEPRLKETPLWPRASNTNCTNLADTLSENATWDDVIEEARFRRAVEAGMRAADRGAFATDDEVHVAFAAGV